MSTPKSWLRNRSLFIRPPRRKPAKKRLVTHVLWTAFKRMLMVFGVVFLVSFIAGTTFVSYFMTERAAPPDLPDEFVLSLTIQPEYVEYHNVAGLGFIPQPMTFRQIIDYLHIARDDERVQGVYAYLKGSPANLAQLQELRDAISEFGDTGRTTYIYAPTLGGGINGLGSYYLASAFDEIWMQPVGSLNITGLGVEIPYLRNTLEKIGVAPQFFARKDYKTIFESLSREQMSDASREMYLSMLTDLSGQMISDMDAEDTDLPALINKGLFTDVEALEEGLVTGLAGEMEIKAKIAKRITGEEEKKNIFLKLSSYRPPKDLRTVRKPGKVGKIVPQAEQSATALIYVTGAIMSESQMAPSGGLSGSEKPSAEDIAAAIMQATWNEAVTTIVLRVDSPGGSPVAAETIRRALLAAKKKDMTIIVSMGEAAASGGYWVAAPADVIFAQAGTITGSIGVAGGKVYDDGLWDTLGVNWDRVEIHDHATMFSFNQPFSESEEALVNRQMDRVYEAFLARVAEGRGMTVEEADAVAQGRVWTGRQALERGLVDHMGGLSSALDYAALQTGYTSRFEMPVYILPKPKSPVELFREMFQGGSLTAALSDAGYVLSTLREYYGDSYGAAKTMSASPVMTYEPVTIR